MILIQLQRLEKTFGTLKPERGEAELWVQLPRDIGQALGAQVTLEPAAPGQEPRGVPQLVSIAS